MPYIKLGKYLRFEESGIRAYLNRNRKTDFAKQHLAPLGISSL